MTHISVPTATITAVPTRRPPTVLARDTVLYTGPGNEGYPGIAQLKAGTVVNPLGLYVDFAKVDAAVGGKHQSGFVAASALSHVPTEIPELKVDEVPWQSVDVLNGFIDSQSSLQKDSILVENNADEYKDIQGSAITLDAPFRISVNLNTSDGQYGSLKLAARDYNAAGPWWQGIRRMDFAANQGGLQIDLHDGTTASGMTIQLSIASSQVVTLTFNDPYGKVLVVSNQGGQIIRTLDMTQLSGMKLAEGLFPEKKIYLGSVASPHSRLTLGSLAVEKAPPGKWVDPPPPKQPTLRQIGQQHGISLGTELGYWQLRDARYWSIMSDDFDTAILSGFGAQDFWRGPGDFDFKLLDNVVDWLTRSGWRIRASHLVWGAPESLPDWLVKGHYSREEYIQILKDRVNQIVSHYQGKVTEWSIANEASSRSLDTGRDFWADKIGPEYIEMAFRWAKEADPHATLIFNDDNNESPRDQRSRRIIDKMFATVKELKSKGVPIDVVGMQMHLLLPWNSKILPQKDDVIKTMRMFADLGVKVYVTEFDVNLHDVKGSQGDRWNFEAQVYRDMVEACLESGVCTSFSTWGISDATSWITCTDQPWCVKLPDADPLLFDKDLQPKPAFYAVRDALSHAR